MNYIFIGVILALLPVVSYFLQKWYCVSKFDKKSFEDFIPVRYMDWFFVLFNFIWIFVVDLNYWIIILFLVALIGGSILSVFWGRTHEKERNPIYLYDSKRKRMSKAGWVHSVYALIQATLVLTFLFFSIESSFVYLSLICLFGYFIIGPYSSKKIHGKFILEDKIYFILGLLAIIVKFVLVLIF